MNLLRIGRAQTNIVLHLAHDSTLRVYSEQGNSSGTAFMVGERLALTCLHVVSHTEQLPNSQITGRIFQDVRVVTPSGEIIAADVISTPTSNDPTPLRFDFAFLQLRNKPSVQMPLLKFASDEELSKIDLGDDVIFSGFPFANPGMVSHKGMISGYTPDKSLFFIQGSINKGNSGGALLSSTGKIIGVVSLREGGITQELANLRQQIYNTQQQGMSEAFMGVDTLASTKMLIDTVDQYISVGIGYAHNGQAAREYLKRHPEFIK